MQELCGRQPDMAQAFQLVKSLDQYRSILMFALVA